MAADAAPALMAFSPSKRRKLALTGTFDAAGMHAMLDGLFSGTRSTTPFQVSPVLSTTYFLLRGSLLTVSTISRVVVIHLNQP